MWLLILYNMKQSYSGKFYLILCYAVYMKNNINTLITDFDNTLFDWFANWYQAFSCALNYITDNIKNINKEMLIDDIKSIHERCGTTEYLNVFNEIAINPKYATYDNIEVVCRNATSLREDLRHKQLCLFDDVFNTLQCLKNNNFKIIIFTESEAYSTLSRIISLKLDGIVDYVYAPPSRNSEIPIMQKTKFKQLDYSEHYKTNPNNLYKIISELKLNKDNCCYLGDNLIKDIEMAKSAGIIDIYAKYGENYLKKKEYQLLKDVTSWTDSMVKKEEKSNEQLIKPTYTLENSIKELLEILNINEDLNV